MHELFVCLNDHGVQVVEDQRHAFKRGAAFFLPQGSSHWVECSEENPGEYCFLCFDHHHFLKKGQESIQDIVDQLVERRERVSLGEDGTGRRNLELVLRAHEEVKTVGPMVRETVDSLLTLLLISFSRGLKSHVATKDEKNEKDKIQQLCLNVKRHPELRLTLEEAARRMSMSRTAFIEAFKRRTGATWVSFLQDARIKKAMELMCHSDLSVSQIAFESGFNHLGHFHSIFKRLTGKTPKTFRNQVSQNGPFPKIMRER